METAESPSQVTVTVTVTARNGTSDGCLDGVVVPVASARICHGHCGSDG